MSIDGTAATARVHLFKLFLSTDLSNFNSYNQIIMYTCDCQFHLNHANWHLSSFSAQNRSGCMQVVY